MTVVAALAREGRVVMAADSCTNYGIASVRGVRKIARIKVGRDDALIAAAGTGALLGLVEHWTCDTTPDPDDPADVQAWAFEAARALSGIAAAQTPPLVEGNQLGGAYLLGWRGRLIYLFTHQAVVVEDGIGALGIGADYAFGFMESGGDTDQALVMGAVEGACRRHDGCRVGPDGPLVEHLDPPPAPQEDRS